MEQEQTEHGPDYGAKKIHSFEYKNMAVNIMSDKTPHPDMDRFEISTRGHHALTAMVDLSRREENRPIPLSDIAASRHISLSYLEQMFAGLRRHGLVKSHRGPGGGYILAMPASAISVAAIIRAAEESSSREQPRRNRLDDSATSKLWGHLNAYVANLLTHVTLDDVASERVEVYQKVFKTQP